MIISFKVIEDINPAKIIITRVSLKLPLSEI